MVDNYSINNDPLVECNKCQLDYIKKNNSLLMPT